VTLHNKLHIQRNSHPWIEDREQFYCSSFHSLKEQKETLRWEHPEHSMSSKVLSFPACAQRQNISKRLSFILQVPEEKNCKLH